MSVTDAPGYVRYCGERIRFFFGSLEASRAFWLIAKWTAWSGRLWPPLRTGFDWLIGDSWL